MVPRTSPVAALAAACLGIALFSVMDGLMKGLALSIGAYSALFWRAVAGTAIVAPFYLASRTHWPSRRVLRIHFARSMLVAVMAVSFFWGIARVPLAEAVALSFIAPLIALALAALVLGERIARRSVLASLAGLSGVAVILAGRIGGRHDEDTLWGMAAVLLSALFYAANLVMARHQAQLARPVEIAFFQTMFTLLLLAVAAPFLLVAPGSGDPVPIMLSTLLALGSLLLMSWANARAEAQLLVNVEYTAFVWAAVVGWVGFGERLTVATLLGTVLIVAACVVATPRRPVALPELGM